MPRNESFYPNDWLRIAEKDLVRAEHLMSVQDPEAAGFYLQQSVEKFLKAFLLRNGWQLQKIHDLEPLLNEALAYDNSFEPYRTVLQKITGFYFVERYPFTLDAGLTLEDIREAINEVKPFIDSLRSFLIK
jgi:HEPN domain-containing protein